MRNNYLKRIKISDILMNTFLIAFGIIILYPFYNSILVSIVPQEVYVKTPFMLYPPELNFASYKFVFSSNTIANGFKVTLFILVFGVLYNMILTVMTAYALTKPIPGRKYFSFFIIFTMYFSGGLIPLYILIQKLGLLNNILSMILPTGINISFMLIIMKFFDEIPKELEESAKIDGANEMVILFKIVLPLSLPVLATFALYYGVERWNEWWHGMLFIKSSTKLPLQMVLKNIIQDTNILMANIPDDAKKEVFTDGIKMASVVITMFPVMCLYPFLQRYFITGLTTGAIK